MACRLEAAGRSASMEGGWLDPELNRAFEQGTDIAITFPDAQPASSGYDAKLSHLHHKLTLDA